MPTLVKAEPADGAVVATRRRAAADVQRAGVAARDPADRSGRPRGSARQYRGGRCRDRDCGAGAAERQRTFSAGGWCPPTAIRSAVRWCFDRRAERAAAVRRTVASRSRRSHRAMGGQARRSISDSRSGSAAHSFAPGSPRRPLDGPAADPLIMTALIAGLCATALSVGLQGLDALELSLREIGHRAAWETGLETSYGLTAIAAGFALFAGCSRAR